MPFNQNMHLLSDNSAQFEIWQVSSVLVLEDIELQANSYMGCKSFKKPLLQSVG